ncbi:MAG: peptide chain release factor N(5)-glutamine methyltransferase [Parvibaculaceae bacterium]|nr:peptide chain release factor N(5)-glutamine methyltransferase [Parvibaculaceae bacterium]
MKATRATSFRSAWARFRELGLESAELDARLILCAAADCSDLNFITDPDVELTEAQLKKFDTFVLRRSGREPVSRLLGEREFWGLTFGLGSATLDPRADTEVLVEAVLEQISDPQADLNLLDLGTGSGCILIALLHELSNAQGTGVDVSAEALRMAGLNAVRHNVSDRADLQTGSWYQALPSSAEGLFDVIVSNPPYITVEEMGHLSPEVALFDPHTALVAGVDGLDAYRVIIDGARSYLSPQGFLALELGAGQFDAVGKLGTAAGLRVLGGRDDLSGHKRVILLAV